MICYLLGLVLAWCALELVEHESSLSVFFGLLGLEFTHCGFVGVRRLPSSCLVLRDRRWEGDYKFSSHNENKETMQQNAGINTILHIAKCSTESTKYQRSASVYAGLVYPVLGLMRKGL